MTEPILHHYRGSPFSEKVRLMLGCKGLAWRSVTVPVVMPKPDVVALTGGYRRTPVLQIGADVWCDTALIAQVLERLQPAPTLFPASAPLAPMLAQWADATLFWTVIPYVMQPAGIGHVMGSAPPEAMQAFAADRKPFTAGLVRRTPADATAALQVHLAALDAQLADGRTWLFGDAVSIADFSVGHCLWFIRLAGPMASILAPHAHLSAWLDRLFALGHGRSTPMDSGDAVAEAAGASGHADATVSPGMGFAPGDAVTVAATDYGRDPVAGLLVGLDLDEVVVRRHDPRAGVVHVHFPRQGFQIRHDNQENA